MNSIMKVRYLWIEIFSYLDPVDIFECDHVCKFFRKILSTNYEIIKDLFSVYFFISGYHLKWYSERIKLLKIEKLVIDDQDSYLRNFEIRDLIKGLDLKSLHLYLTYTLDKLINLEELVIQSQCIDEDQYQYLQNIKRISIRCNIMQFEGLLWLNNLVSLDLWFVSQKDYYTLVQVLEQNKRTLKELCIDAKQFSRYEVTQIINTLNPRILTTFKLYHFSNYHVEHLDVLKEFKYINNISISARIYNSITFYQFVQFKSFLSVNFSKCESFNDQCLDLLTYYSPQLVNIDISETKCSNKSVQRLFLNCLYLKEVDLSGLELLTDKFLPLQQDWDKILRHSLQYLIKQLENLKKVKNTYKFYMRNPNDYTILNYKKLPHDDIYIFFFHIKIKKFPGAFIQQFLMSLEDFAQSLNLDEETKLRAQDILKTATEYDESLWTPAVVYFCCWNAQVATLDGGIHRGNGVTLASVMKLQYPQVIRTLDPNCDLEKFLELLDKVPPRANHYSMEYQQIVDKAQLSYRLYKKFEQSFSKLEKIDNPSATPSFRNIEDYLTILKRVTWILYLLVRQKVNNMDTEYIRNEDLTKTLIMVVVESLVIQNTPEQYSLQCPKVPKDMGLKLFNELSKSSDFLGKSSDLSEELEEFIEMCDLPLRELFERICGINPHDLFQENTIQSTYEKIHQYYQTLEKEELDEECFLRHKVAYTPKRKKVVVEELDRKRERGNVNMFTPKKLKDNQFSRVGGTSTPNQFQDQQRESTAKDEKSYFEIRKPSIIQTPITKMLESCQWRKRMISEKILKNQQLINDYDGQVLEEIKKLSHSEVDAFYKEQRQSKLVPKETIQLFMKILDMMIDDKNYTELIYNTEFLNSILCLTIIVDHHLNQLYVDPRQVFLALKISPYSIFRVLSNFTHITGIPAEIINFLFNLEKSIMLQYIWEDKQIDNTFDIIKKHERQLDELKFWQSIFMKRFESHLMLRVKEVTYYLEISQEAHVYELISTFLKSPLRDLLVDNSLDLFIICTVYMIQKYRKQNPEFKKIRDKFQCMQSHKKQEHSIFYNIVNFYNDQFLPVFKEILLVHKSPHSALKIDKTFLAQSPIAPKRNSDLFSMGEQIHSPKQCHFANQIAQQIKSDRISNQ
ncbi:hypothetical protein pb186bvf_006829 [Paramecium bursaria]